MLGSVDVSLELIEVGLNHSHWLTLGRHILCYNVSQEKPSSVLSILAGLRFKIKLNNKITDGSINFLSFVSNSDEISKKRFKILLSRFSK